MNKENTKIEIDIIPKFLDSALTPVAKEVGERLADIVSLLFTPVIKAKAKRDKNIEIFLRELDKKVSSIPENNLQNPPLAIVGPIIDKIFKFHHDEEHLRKMYSSLIASSMNSDKKVHPSYIEIIKQLSSDDALIFNTYFLGAKYIFKSFGLIGEPICFYTFYSRNPFNLGLFGLFFYEKNNKLYLMDESMHRSLQSLIRLGLIQITIEIASDEIFKRYSDGIFIEEDINLKTISFVTTPTPFGGRFASMCCDISRNTNCLINKYGQYVEKITLKDGFIDCSIIDRRIQGIKHIIYML